MKQATDSWQEHNRKIARKRKQLIGRGWSDARIKQYLKDWSRFDPRTHNKRMNDAKSF